MQTSESDNLPEIVQQTFIAVPPATVYQTLSSSEGWDQWFTTGTRLDPRPGGEIHLRWQNFGAGRYTLEDRGQVLEAIPNRSFVFTWKPGPTRTRVAFALQPLADGTLLTVSESGYRNTDADLRTYMDCASGWGEALTLLKFFLEHRIVYGPVPPTDDQA